MIYIYWFSFTKLINAFSRSVAIVGLLNWLGLRKRPKKASKTGQIDADLAENEPEMDEKTLLAQLTRTRHEIRAERLRYLKERLAQIKQQNEEMLLEDELAEIEGEDDDEPEAAGPESADALMLGLLAKVFGGQSQPQPPPVAVAATTQENPSDDEIRAIKAKLPAAYIPALKAATPEQIRALIEQYQPNISENAKQRAIKILQE